MIKRTLALVAIVAAMASCSKDSVVDNGAITAAGRSIGFSTYSEASRGAAFDGNTSFETNGQTFTASAFNATTDDAHFANKTITYNSTGSSWNFPTGEIHYWPESDALNFFAYASAGTAGTFAITKDGIAVEDYTVPSFAGNHEDLMVGVLNGQTYSSNSGTAQIPFEHALTQVNFKAKCSNSALTVTIGGLYIYNLQNKGTLAMSENTSATGTSNTIADATTTENFWTVKDTPAAADLHDFAFVPANFTTGQTTITNPVTLSATAQNITNATDVAMFMPQSFDAWKAEGTGAESLSATLGAYIGIICKIQQTDGTYLYGNGTDYALAYFPISSLGSDGTTEIWKAGNKLTYTLDFAATGGFDEPTTPTVPTNPTTPTTPPTTTTPSDPVLKIIRLAVNVANWNDVTGPDMNL